MRIRVIHGIDDLANDMRAIPPKAVKGFRGALRTNLREGNAQAKAFAKESSGGHGKYYPQTFTTEMHGATANGISGEYGPDAEMVVQGKAGSLRPGAMDFEFGSRNQRPHLDLARSADIIGRQFADDIDDVVDGLFW